MFMDEQNTILVLIDFGSAIQYKVLPVKNSEKIMGTVKIFF